MVETTKNLGGAPEGNQNAALGARWRNAIDKALELRCKSDGQKALVEIASAMLDKAQEGDMTAIKELGDRMDGKSPQAIDLNAQVKGNMTIELIKEFIPSNENPE